MGWSAVRVDGTEFAFSSPFAAAPLMLLWNILNFPFRIQAFLQNFELKTNFTIVQPLPVCKFWLTFPPNQKTFIAAQFPLNAWKKTPASNRGKSAAVGGEN